MKRSPTGRSPSPPPSLLRWHLRMIGFTSRLHRDQRGSMSIVTVFTLLLFTSLLVMLVNVGTHVDDKLKMQNAADAASYSGGIVLSRGMNGLAFSNHLLCDTFALTAFLRESRDRHAETHVPAILSAWRRAGELLEEAEFPPFARLGTAILNKVPKEQEAVSAFGELAAGSSRLTLPIFEHVLSERLIGRFQRDLMETVPDISQEVTNEVARRHGLLGRSDREGSSALMASYEAQRGRQFGVLWKTMVEPVALGDESTPRNRTLPVVDPDPNELDYPQVEFAEEYLRAAIEQRRALSRHYLNDWNFDRLDLFHIGAKMSTFYPLWRIATCDQLERLLNREYPLTNLPMVLRRTDDGREMQTVIRQAQNPLPGVNFSIRNDLEHPIVMDGLRGLIDVNQYIDRNFHFVGVISRKHRVETGPGVFKNALSARSDAQTFAQVRLFIPRPRKVLGLVGGGGSGVQSIGGVFGYSVEIGAGGTPQRPTRPANPLDERWGFENWPTSYDLFNQNWMVELVPATTRTLPQILATNPGGELSSLRMPDFANVSNRQIKQVSGH